MKAKLLEDADHYDWLAAKADRAAEEAAGFKTRPIKGLVSTRDPVKNDVNKTNFLCRFSWRRQTCVRDILLRYAIEMGCRTED